MRYEVQMRHENVNGIIYCYVDIPNGTKKPTGRSGNWKRSDALTGSNDTQTEELLWIAKEAERMGTDLQAIHTMTVPEFKKISGFIQFKLGSKYFIQVQTVKGWLTQNLYYIGVNLELKTVQELYYFATLGGGIVILRKDVLHALRIGHYKIGRFVIVEESGKVSGDGIRNEEGREWLLGQLKGQCIEHAYPPLAEQMAQTATGLPLKLRNNLKADGSYTDRHSSILLSCPVKSDTVPCHINLFYSRAIKKWEVMVTAK